MKPTWPQVVVIGIIVAGVVTLTALGRDTSVLIGLATLLLAGVGLIAGTQFAIKDNTNGNMSALLAMVKEMYAMLAAAPPIKPPPATEQPPPPADPGEG